MSVSPPEAVGSPSFGASSGSGTTSSATQMDKDMFLKLMVAQLKNQDPMNPTDSSEFLAQTAQFTSLEKLDAVATQTAQALSAQMAFGASGLVGRTVTYTDATGAEATGTVDSVRFTATGPLLGVAGAEVEIGNVTKVAG
jgi:flagellar basal-body rod modification protein FlgD